MKTFEPVCKDSDENKQFLTKAQLMKETTLKLSSSMKQITLNMSKQTKPEVLMLKVIHILHENQNQKHLPIYFLFSVTLNMDQGHPNWYGQINQVYYHTV